MRMFRAGSAIVFGALIIALASSAIYQTIASERAASAYPVPGKLVDVGGYRLHFDCVGSGETTVVLEAGGGSFSLGWGSVQPDLAGAANTRVCSYDRAGLGWSDENPEPYSIAGEVEALHRGLRAIGVNGGIVLVGHSYGGFLVRLYASRFPQEVVGMVLVDPNTVTFFERQRHVLGEVHTQAWLLGAAAPLGLVRWIAGSEFRDSIRFPKVEDVNKMLDLSLTTKHLGSLAAMLSEFSNTVALMQTLDTPTGIPLTLLSRGRADLHPPWGNPASEADWRDGHKLLVGAAKNGTLIIAEKSDHMIMFDQPEAIVGAVKSMVDQTRGELR